MELKDLNPKKYILTKEQESNALKLCSAINELQSLCEMPFLVTSGIRSVQDQLRINPSVKSSAHMSGEAVDISDVDGAIYGWCMDNLDILIRLGIYLECRTSTPRWIHCQIRVPKSGRRIFIP